LLSDANSGNIPIIGDWDGTGTYEFCVFRNGCCNVDWNGNGTWDTVDAKHVGFFGAKLGDVAIVRKLS